MGILNMFLIGSEILNHRAVVGGKAVNLQQLIEAGLSVPKFIVIPASATTELLLDVELRSCCATDAHTRLGVGSYAVRSSALIEDTSTSSFAGQFHTELDITPENLGDAIARVLMRAHKFLDGNLDAFAFIIQEYIPSDFAGVIFSRNPNGTRDMVINFARGAGEQVVSGAITPEHLQFYWSESEPQGLEQITGIRDGVAQSKKLEYDFGMPLDIEWCATAEVFYFLQARPITTISPQQYKTILFLETLLPNKSPYYFAKTELSEIAPRPTPLTFSLLEKIYADDGPVACVYKKHGVHYRNTKFLHLFGNELFVDKEAELKSLLPSYTYFSSKNLKPKWGTYKDSLITIKNVFALNSIRVPDQDIFYQKIKKTFENVEDFMTGYVTVFETNLFAGIAAKRLELAMRNEPIVIADIYSSASLFIDFDKLFPFEINKQKLQGNSLEIGDTSQFITFTHINNKWDERVEQWWKSVSQAKRAYLNPIICTAVAYMRLREYGRWLTVTLASQLRGKELFATIDENVLLISDGEKYKKRREEYEFYNLFELPIELTSYFIVPREKPLGLSAGVAEGVLITAEDVESGKYNSEENVILYSRALSPSLVEYFGKIKGIISEEGGMLSHLAIMAREAHVPVVNSKLQIGNVIKIGSRVKIDGTTGKIDVISIS